MFKRKSNLPPRPQCPTASHIVEDLTAASGDSHFLNTAKSINAEGPKSEESQVRDAGYQKLKSFLEDNQELLDVMQELKTIYENLQSCHTEIAVLSEELRDQAVKALL